MATSKWESRDSSSTDNYSNTEGEEEVKYAASYVMTKFAACAKTQTSGRRAVLAKWLVCIVLVTSLVLQENLHTKIR